MEQVAKDRRARFTPVPFKGSADTVTALLGGHVDAISLSSAWAPYVDAGKLRLLATFGEQRSKRWPSAPTLKELGYRIVSESPYGLAGPKGMDAKTVRVLHDAFKTALGEPQIQQMLEQLDQVPAYLGPEDYVAQAQREFAEYGRLIKALGLAESP
jgi:tripartite-type tricarboxylate transporter receptor subunit TctC